MKCECESTTRWFGNRISAKITENTVRDNEFIVVRLKEQPTSTLSIFITDLVTKRYNVLQVQISLVTKHFEQVA